MLNIREYVYVTITIFNNHKTTTLKKAKLLNRSIYNISILQHISINQQSNIPKSIFRHLVYT